VAVLEKKVGLSLSQQDIFVNAVGGVRIDEPAVDLAIASVVASSLLDRIVDPQTVLVGEVGLTGEIRGVGRGDLRVNEAARLGFSRCVLPKGTVDRVPIPSGVELVGVGSLTEALEVVFR